MSELKWYVLKSISGQENKVKNYIEIETRIFRDSGSYSYGEDLYHWENREKNNERKAFLPRIFNGGS